MRYKAPGQCPVCNNELTVTKLSCAKCGTKLEGEFSTCKFCRLPAEQRDFIEVFIKCRGNIKDVEKELGISYPTVRNRLDAAIEALGYRVERDAGELAEEKEERQARQDVLDSLERGGITPQEATKQLKKLTTK